MVDADDVAFDNGTSRLFDVERDLEVPGEVVEGPQRQHSHRLFAAGQDGRDRADRAVTATHDDDVARSGGRLPRETEDIRAVFRALEVHLHARVLAKRVAQALVDLAVPRASGGAIQDDRQGCARCSASFHFFSECKTPAGPFSSTDPRTVRRRKSPAEGRADARQVVPAVA